MKARKDIILERFLSNVTAAIIIGSSRFLISKSILQRYNFSFYIRNIRILLTIDEIFYFFLIILSLFDFLLFANEILIIFLFRFSVYL
jgi:hypothetical protein